MNELAKLYDEYDVALRRGYVKKKDRENFEKKILTKPREIFKNKTK